MANQHVGFIPSEQFAKVWREHNGDTQRIANAIGYSLRAVYVRDGQRVESNALRFEVSKPTGDEAQVFAAVRETPSILDGRGDPPLQAKLQALLATYPMSRYLRWARIQLLKEREASPRSGIEPAWAQYLELAKEAERGDWGPFEEDALALAWRAARSGGDDVLADRLRKSLLELHPDSAAARDLRRFNAER